jgi:hypothetical protein
MMREHQASEGRRHVYSFFRRPRNRKTNFKKLGFRVALHAKNPLFAEGRRTNYAGGLYIFHLESRDLNS